MLHDDEKRSAAASEQEGAPAPERGDIEAFLQSEDLTEGQRRRLRVLQAVEQAVTARVEEMCSTTTVEVTDVAVLVVAPERNKLHAFLTDVLPPARTRPSIPTPICSARRRRSACASSSWTKSRSPSSATGRS